MTNDPATSVAVRPRADVLVVDDRQDNLLAFKAALKDPSLNVVTASSGQEALRTLLARPVVAILLDVAMPTMDGFEAAALIRGRRKMRDVPILLITASETDSAQLARGFAAGAADYLVKPISADVLLAKVNAMVDLHQAAENRRLALEAALHADREYIRDLHSATTAHDSLLGDLSFALRMPLTALKLSVQRTLLLTREGSRTYDHLSAANAQTVRMAELLDEAAAIWSARVPGAENANGVFDLEATARQAVEELASRTAAGSLPIVIEVGKNARGGWNQNALRALVRCLIRYSRGTARDVALTLKISTGDDEVELLVRDQCDRLAQPPHPPHSADVHLVGADAYAVLASHAARVLGGRISLGSMERADVIAAARFPLDSAIRPVVRAYPLNRPALPQ